MEPAGECSSVHQSRGVVVPLSGMKVSGEIKSFGHESNMPPFDGDHRVVSVQKLEEGGEGDLGGLSCEVVQENGWLSIVSIEPHSSVGEGGDVELVDVIGCKDEPCFATSRWAVEEDDSGRISEDWTGEDLLKSHESGSVSYEYSRVLGSDLPEVSSVGKDARSGCEVSALALSGGFSVSPRTVETPFLLVTVLEGLSILRCSLNLEVSCRGDSRPQA